MDNKTFNFKELVKKEADRINAQRKVRSERKVELFNEQKQMGLAISGGGIRSASFALGVLQSLNGVEINNERIEGDPKSGKVIEQLDYLSTVSGGGYIGSALTWFNQQNSSGSSFYFPFGKKYTGARSHEHGEHGDILGYLRQHGNYLVPGSGLSFFSALMVVLRSMSVSFLIYFALLVLGFCALIQGGVFEPFMQYWIGISPVRFPNWVLMGAAVLGAGFLICGFLYALGTYWVPKLTQGKWRDYQFRLKVQVILGYLGSLIVVFLVIGTVPLAMAQIDKLPLFDSQAVGGGASILGIIGGVYEFMRQQKGKSSGSLSGLRIVLTCILLIYGFAVLAYSVAVQVSGEGSGLLFAIGAITLFAALFVNLNYFNLGRMYRDRLSETFLAGKDAVKSNQWMMAIEADKTLISQVNGDDQQGPYHIINANVILTDAISSKYRGRGGDNFILSPIACGSNATRGWMPSETFDRGNMTLATAMAISGAAANPHTGPSGGGLTRGRAVSFLMFLLGVRLGYYVANPDKGVKGYQSFLTQWFKPNYLYPGIKQGLLGRGFDTRAGYLELSDGGHFENLGLYELIRRKLDLIIISDGGADPKFSFQDLANAVEKVRVDFGVIIKFDDDEYDLRHLMPGSAGDSLFARRYDLADRGFAVGKIYYDGATKVGKLLYVKTTMTRDLPADIYGYKDANPSYPDQSTADQFFDEFQFEAYRELGYQTGKSMLGDKYVQEIFKQY